MNIFKSSLTKKILGIVVIMLGSGVFLNGYVGMGEPTYAQSFSQAQGYGSSIPGSVQTIDTTATGSTSIDSMGLWQILNMVLKIIYLLLWPLLVVAGLALDNTLVYASIFHLDAPLWKFWNMMKNFANFTLGFMVLFAIIKSIITNSGEGSIKDEKTPLGIIKKTLIAGILIQASWFLMAALVDVSTIATYAVGGLPLSVLKNTDIGSQKILSVNSSIDLNKFDVLSPQGESFKVWYSTVYSGQTIKISPCRVEKSFIIGREFGDPEYSNASKFIGDPIYSGYEVCVLFGNQLVMWQEPVFLQAISDYKHASIPTDSKGGYTMAMNALLDITGWQTQSRVTTTLVNIKSGSKQDGFVKGASFFAASDSMTISDLISKSKGFVGPLVTMYSSLLNFAQLTDTNVTTIGETSGIFLIKTGVAIALFFPLLALAVVLIARIGLLRLFIIASPFIIIKESFKDFIKIEKLDEYLSIKGVLGIIFAPVVTVAALSLSLIFMTALINGFKSDDNQQISSQVSNSLQIQSIPAKLPGDQAFKVGGSSELEFKNFDRGGSLDRFSWLIVNFFAIGLLRTILFAAIKANALGKAIGAPIQKFGANAFSTLPILPISEGGKGVGVGSVFTVLGDAPNKKLQDIEATQTQKVTELLYPKDTTPPTTLTSTQATTIIPSAATTSSAITAAVEKLGVKEADVGTVLSGSTANLVAAINAAAPDEKKRLELATAVYEASGPVGGTKTLSKDWYTTSAATETTTAAKTALDAITSVAANEAALNTIVTTPKAEQKKALDAYFITGTETYTTPTIDNVRYDITKKTDGTYVAVKTTRITNAEKTLKESIGTPANKAALEKFFVTDGVTNKTDIEDYFTAASKDTFTMTAGGIEYTITKTGTTSPFTYTVTP